MYYSISRFSVTTTATTRQRTRTTSLLSVRTPVPCVLCAKDCATYHVTRAAYCGPYCVLCAAYSGINFTVCTMFNIHGIAAAKAAATAYTRALSKKPGVGNLASRWAAPRHAGC